MIVKINGDRGHGKTRIATMIYDGAFVAGWDPLVLVHRESLKSAFRINSMALRTVPMETVKTIDDLVEGRLAGYRSRLVIVDELGLCAAQIPSWQPDRLMAEINSLLFDQTSQLVLIN